MSWEIVVLWLPVLACPLIMWWCMRGVSRGRPSGAEQQGGGSRAGAEASSSHDLREEIGALKARLALLEAQRARRGEEVAHAVPDADGNERQPRGVPHV